MSWRHFDKKVTAYPLIRLSKSRWPAGRPAVSECLFSRMCDSVVLTRASAWSFAAESEVIYHVRILSGVGSVSGVMSVLAGCDVFMTDCDVSSRRVWSCMFPWKRIYSLFQLYSELMIFSESDVIYHAYIIFENQLMFFGVVRVLADYDVLMTDWDILSIRLRSCTFPLYRLWCLINCIMN